jgi:hypothetical protein
MVKYNTNFYHLPIIKFCFSLRLEWNQLGALNSPAFSVFCDALADNKSLIELDLRNNDINHVGASELASALKRNTTLRALGISSNQKITLY